LRIPLIFCLSFFVLLFRGGKWWVGLVGKCRREADFPALDERPLKEFDCLSNTAKCFDIFHTLDNQLEGWPRSVGERSGQDESISNK